MSPVGIGAGQGNLIVTEFFSCKQLRQILTNLIRKEICWKCLEQLLNAEEPGLRRKRNRPLAGMNGQTLCLPPHQNCLAPWFLLPHSPLDSRPKEPESEWPVSRSLCTTLPVGGTGRNLTKGPSRLLTIREKLFPSGK